jgi:GT2 family glycosyltransferase
MLSLMNHKAIIKEPHVSVIVLNWNRWQDTIVGIESLFGNDYINYDLIVLDNGSADDSIHELLAWFQANGRMSDVLSPPKRFRDRCTVVAESAGIILLRNETNEGFAGGNNTAIAYAMLNRNPEYVFLLNNDAVVAKDCLANLVGVAESSNAAIVGALVKSSDGLHVRFSGAEPLIELFAAQTVSDENSLPDVWDTGRVEASGELIAVEFLKERLSRYGYIFDPRYFLYCEDTDLALCARAAGKKIVMTKKAILYHGLAQSTGGGGNPLQYYYITRNRIFLAQRWLPISLKIIFHIYYPISRILRAFQRILEGKFQVGGAILEGLFDGYLGNTGQWKKHRK